MPARTFFLRGQRPRTAAALQMLSLSQIAASDAPMMRKRVFMAKYGSKAKSEVKRAMHKAKRGRLHSGKAKKTVKSRKQAIAIGLSKARKKGAKVPPKRKIS